MSRPILNSGELRRNLKSGFRSGLGSIEGHGFSVARDVPAGIGDVVVADISDNFKANLSSWRRQQQRCVGEQGAGGG